MRSCGSRILAALQALQADGVLPRGTGPCQDRGRSRRAMPRTAISRPTPQWSWQSRSARARGTSRPSSSKLQGRRRSHLRRSRRTRLHQPPPRPGCLARRPAAALERGADFGRADIGKGEKVNVEYVSANPTGPMHVGHTRGAVFGDALASLMATRATRSPASITSTMPAGRSIRSRTRRSCATARRSARSSRFRVASIPAIT